MKRVIKPWTRLPLVFKALFITAVLVTAALVINHQARLVTAMIECKTNLKAAHVGSESATFSQDCKGDEELEGTEVLWHFVLVQTTDGNETSQLTACFENSGCQTVPGTKFTGGVIHWNVITPANDKLVSACTDAVGGELLLSHVCGGGGGGASSNITTVVHKGATDIGDPIVVGSTCDAVDAPATVHDSGVLTTTPTGVTMPVGSTVTFFFFNNGTCNAPAWKSSAPDFDVSGQTSPVSIDPALAQSNLTPGNYSYIAVFSSGDGNIVASSVGECEPFRVFAAPLTPGYWKTHLELSKTSKNGPFTKDYLPQLLGTYNVDTIAKATAVWDKMNCSASGDNDALGCLAGHLLATKLNVANGSNPCIQATIDAADALLISLGYSGPGGSYTLSATQRSLAISLKTTLDQYNNGKGCPPDACAAP
jgi:hypothetical protein